MGLIGKILRIQSDKFIAKYVFNFFGILRVSVRNYNIISFEINF